MQLRPIQPCLGALAAAMLSGCMASDPSLSTDASFSSSSTELSASGEFAMLPETVAVLPTRSGSDEVQVAYAVPDGVPAAAFAGSQPNAARAEGHVFLEPEPVALMPRTRPLNFPPVAGGSDEVNRLVEKYAALYEVPVGLVRRVIKRESNFNPAAYYRGHWGLMQIKHATARGMGYDGPARGLLDAETNLRYAVKYLRGAWMVAEGNPELADRLYQRGYYWDAKRKGLLDETGLGHDRVRRRGSV